LNFKSFILVAVLIICIIQISAQTIQIKGNVIDAASGEAMPYVNISLAGKTAGTISDTNGQFELKFNKSKNDTITLSSIGYKTLKIPVSDITDEIINVQMSTDLFSLPEVTILPGENPAMVLLRAVIDNKDKNRTEKMDFYSCEVYNKIRFDINNFSDKFSKRRAMRHFAFVFENVDTSEVTGKIYLPVFFTESFTDFYYRRKPQTKREIVKASRFSGIKNESISRFMGNMYQEIVIYDNYIPLFEKNFVSPISDNGHLFYKYYLVDSAIVNNLWCYRLDFKPRRKQELTFEGHIWIHVGSFAVQSYEMDATGDANINFVNFFSIAAEFEPAGDVWVKKRESVFLDFTLLNEFEKSTGFFANKTTSYDKYSFDIPDEDIFSNPNHVISLDNNQTYDDEFWNNQRHEDLSEKEDLVYNMVDSLKSMPIFNTYIDIIVAITTGYYVKGWFEFGPYMSLLSLNDIEGVRLGMGFRTSNDFSTIIMPYGNIAYGFDDEKIKYGFGALYMFNKIPRRTLELSYKYDLEQLGKSEDAIREDFLIGTVFTRGPIDKLLLSKNLRAEYQHEWFSGFMTGININYRHFYAPENERFIIRTHSYQIGRTQIWNTEIGAEIRYAPRERFVSGEFVRLSLGSKYPITSLRITKGISPYNYLKVNLNYSHWFNIGSIGWSKFVIDAGKIFGNAPYPFIKIHEGNQTFFFDEKAFNMMNYFEFVNDQWASIYYTHHFDGLFFNKIPILRRLKLREVVWGKALYGTTGEDNVWLNVLPQNVNHLDKVYFEAGVGVENIFNFFRVDAGWRFTHLDNPDISKLSVMFGIQVII
jgi:hypothetical protein